VDIREIPKSISFESFSFRLLCGTFIIDNHFKALFSYDDTYYLLNDLKNEDFEELIPEHRLTSCFYVLDQ